MRNLFNTFARYTLLRFVFYLLLGLAMLFMPAAIITAIVYIIGGYLVVMGLVNIAMYFMHKSDSSFELVGGILLAVIGVLLFVFTRQVASILPIFIGVFLVLAGIFQLVQGLDSKRVLGKFNWLQIVLGILVIVGGVIGIINPFDTLVVLFQLFGALLLIMAVNELLAYIQLKKIAKSAP